MICLTWGRPDCEPCHGSNSDCQFCHGLLMLLHLEAFFYFTSTPKASVRDRPPNWFLSKTLLGKLMSLKKKKKLSSCYPEGIR